MPPYYREVELHRAQAIVDHVVSNAPGRCPSSLGTITGRSLQRPPWTGAPPDSRLNAQRKAYTAARSDAATTRELAEKVRDNPVERASFDPFFTFFLGGVGVFDGGRKIGAVGVSGLPARSTNNSRLTIERPRRRSPSERRRGAVQSLHSPIRFLADIREFFRKVD